MGNGNAVIYDNTGAVWALLTPHGERERGAIQVVAHHLGKLLTPHGERELPDQPRSSDAAKVS